MAELWPEIAAALVDEQDRLRSLVDDLLTLAGLDETSARPLARGEVDLDDLAVTEAERSRRVPVTATITSPHQIEGDEHLLQRCLSNLVDNAAHHARTEVRITVTAEVGGATTWVDDDGPGTPPELADTVFERFTRLGPWRSRDGGGAGLGLAIPPVR